MSIKLFEISGNSCSFKTTAIEYIINTLLLESDFKIISNNEYEIVLGNGKNAVIFFKNTVQFLKNKYCGNKYILSDAQKQICLTNSYIAFINNAVFRFKNKFERSFIILDRAFIDFLYFTKSMLKEKCNLEDYVQFYTSVLKEYDEIHIIRHILKINDENKDFIMREYLKKQDRIMAMQKVFNIDNLNIEKYLRYYYEDFYRTTDEFLMKIKIKSDKINVYNVYNVYFVRFYDGKTRRVNEEYIKEKFKNVLQYVRRQFT